jgi:acetyl esterase
MHKTPAAIPTHTATLADRIERGLAHFVFGLSAGTKRALFGKPAERDGNRLDPDLQVMLRLRALATGSSQGTVRVSPEQSRRDNRRECVLYQGPAGEVGAVSDLTIETPAARLAARHYAPVAQPGDGAQPKPLLVFFHGGGFVFGDLDTHDVPCRVLCQHADVHVLSVAYRLAPELPFPAAVDDAVAAFRFAVAHAAELGADPARVGVAGDSAGGNLSAVVAQLTRGERAPSFAVLIYPAVDRKNAYPSQSLFARDFLLTAEDIEHFNLQYFANDEEKRRDPRLSPLLCPDLSGLCPSVVVTAGFDPLRDEGAAYAEALARAGNQVTLRCERDLTHGFIHLTRMSARCQRALLAVADDVRRLSRA